MLIIHKYDSEDAESIAAKLLGNIACEFCPEIKTSSNIILELIPSANALGKKYKISIFWYFKQITVQKLSYPHRLTKGQFILFVPQ
jgi:hypothetical protein